MNNRTIYTYLRVILLMWVDNINHLCPRIILAMLISMMGIQAFAHDIAVRNADGVAIYYSGDLSSTELVVSYRGSNFKTFDDEYSGNVSIPESVVYEKKTYRVVGIVSDAFRGCSGLTSVTIPTSVTSIGDYAFDGCSGLKSITIPTSVTSIGNYVFYGCSGLTSVTIPNSVTSIGNYAFYGCSSLTSVTIPNSVTSIGNYAFYGCSSLNSITIPSSVMTIGVHPFSDCIGLTSIEVESGNTFYDSRNNCNAIIETRTNKLIAGCQSTVIPNTVTSIGDYAFDGCSGLISVIIPNSVTSIENYAFYYCSGLTSVIIPNSVTSIGAYAFYECRGLTSVTIPNSVTSIGDHAFYECRGMTSVTIPNSVTNIGAYAFYECRGLTSATIPNSVTSIGNCAFGWCTSLTSVIIPNSVTSIGEHAFYGCRRIKEIHSLIEQPFAIEPSVFQYLDDAVRKFTTATLYVPIGTKSKYQATEGWKNFTNIVEEGGTPDDVTLTAKNYTREYGEENPAFGYDVTSGTITSGQPTFSCTATKTSPVGTYDIVIQKGTVSNGTVNLVKGTLTITKAALTISAGNYSKKEGEDNPEFTLTYSGFKNGETQNVLTKQPAVSCSATKNSPAGSYTVSVSGAEAQNYEITYQNGTLTVTEKPADNITFADANVKAICVQHWDTNGDGELSKTEAAAVSDIGTVFSSTTIQSFNELQYFTGLKTIGEKAFWDCRSLASVHMPSSVTSCEEFAFWGCTGLQKLHITDLAAWCKIKFVDRHGNPLYYAQHLYMNNEEIKELSIPSYVRSVGSYAFYECSGLTAVTIPSSVTSIGSYAFARCSGLTSINVESGNTIYDSRNNCNAIIETRTNKLVLGCKNSTIPNTVTSIGTYAFSNCEGLASVTIPNSVTSIGSYAFDDCTSLTSIIIPNSVTSIGGYAFTDCDALASVTIPNSVTSIEDCTFYRCTSLTSVVIPNSVTSIKFSAFGYCSGLTSITIGKSVTSFGNYAFGWLNNLKEVHSLIEQPFAFDNSVFNSYSSATLYVPSGTKAKYQSTEGWKDFANIVEEGGSVPADNITFADANVKTLCVVNWDTNSDGELSKAEAAAVTDLGEVFQNSKIQSFNELQYFTGLKSIGESAFFGCTSLTSVIIPNSVTSFGENAFGQCWKLSSINFPESLTSIGKYAFWHCESLTSVTIPRYVTYIGITAFSGCIELTSIDVDARNYYFDSRTDCNAIIDSYTSTLIAGCKNTVIPNTITTIAYYALHSYPSATITIPNSITTIEEGAFQNSRLTSITLPNSVTSIGQSAFANCESLKSVYIGNSVESIGIYAFRNCGNLEEVHISVELPFAINTNVFENEYNSVKEFTTATLYVPIGTKARYLSIEGWLNFAKIVEEESNNTPTVYNITFADANVKAICVQHWDTDGDRELSMEEAEAVTDIGTIFRGNTDIQSFFELQYFTGLKSIPSYAFEECTNLTTLAIPKAVTSIGDYAFYRCSKLADLITHDLIINIGEWAFAYNTSMTSFAMPNSASTIGSYAFAECEGLNMVVIMDLDYWFKVKFGSVSANPLFYAKRLYINGKELKELVFPDNITNIGDFLFTGSNLTSVTIPNSVKSIGSSVFYKCNNLKEVHSLIEQPFAIDPSVFQYKNNYSTEFTTATLYVPAGTKAKYQATDGWNNFTNIVEEGGSVPADNITFADANVRALCVANWDTNHDGYLSKTEAAAVTDLGEVFRGNRDIQSFDELQYFTGLTTIGEHAFHDCRGLTSITLPNSVTTIGFGAFWYCESLTSLVIPGSVKTINQSAIFVCRSLTSITIPKSVTSIGIQNLNYCNNLTTVKVESGNTVYDSRNNCNAIIETNTNTLIAGCKGTTIPSTVTAIGRIAFQGSDLTTITIPNSVTSIGASCFLACKKLTTITIPSSVTTLGGTLFYGCEVLSTIKVESGSTVYDSRDNCNAIIEKNTNTLVAGCKNTIIPSTVTSIGANAFRSCYGLTSITIPNSVKSIEEGAFQDCTGLKEVYSLIEKPFAIGMDVFQYDDNGETKFTSAVLYVPAGTKSKYQTTDGWKNFTNIVEEGGETPVVDNITFADANVKAICVENWDTNGDGELSRDEAARVTDLGDVFRRNADIKAFPELLYFTNLKSIPEAAFLDCTNLNHIYLPHSVTSIGLSAFLRCKSLTYITIPNAVKTIENTAFSECSGLKSIKVESANTVYDSRNDCNAIIVTETNRLILGCQNTVIPNTVKTIAVSAFGDCIGLTSINIPASVESIEIYAFNSCTGLTSITVESDNPVYDSRNGCNAIIETKTNKLIVGCQSTVIPNTVTRIEEVAFYGCSTLTAIDIPNSVTSIGESAFFDCTGLTTVTIPNSVRLIEESAFLKTNILSLIWNHPSSLTQEIINTFKEDRANMLVYVTDESVLPETGSTDNIVVNGVAQNVVLTENSPFYCAQAFTAKNISFTHYFQMETGKGSAAGWETIVLPFNVTKITHDKKGELVPFARYTDNSQGRPFWLCELGSNGFKRAQGIEANKPYIISMPNNSAYSSEYCVDGKVTFAGTNVTVKKSDEADLTTVAYNGLTFKPTYAKLNLSDNQSAATPAIYAINAITDYSTETGYKTAGSVFIQNLRDVRPFEAYFETGSAAAREFVPIDFADDAVTGLEEVLYGIKSNSADGIRIYNMAGQLVRKSNKKAINEATKGLPSGIYVINGKKTILY